MKQVLLAKNRAKKYTEHILYDTWYHILIQGPKPENKSQKHTKKLQIVMQ